jgi:hypothetical protein
MEIEFEDRRIKLRDGLAGVIIAVVVVARGGWSAVLAWSSTLGCGAVVAIPDVVGSTSAQPQETSVGVTSVDEGTGVSADVEGGADTDVASDTSTSGRADDGTTGEDRPQCPADPLHPMQHAPLCSDEMHGAWSVMSEIGSPPQFDRYTMIWAGHEAIVWAGEGGAYDPSTDTWRTLASDGAPTDRAWHTATWTGTEMIIWGGSGRAAGFGLADGARYDPSLDTWRRMTDDGAPSQRYSHTAVWTGSEMIVWGGFDSYLPVAGGGRYDPALDIWAPISDVAAPQGGDVALWTGTEMIIWGGKAPTGEVLAGGRYDPASDSWQPMTMTGAPSFISQSSGFWTGSAAIFYGGCCVTDGLYRNRAAVYDPLADAWMEEVPLCLDSPAHAVAVWTGCDLLVWLSMGQDREYAVPPDVLRFDGETTWRTAASSPPEQRFQAKAVWTGDAMIVWGGLGGGADDVGPGGVYRP